MLNNIQIYPDCPQCIDDKIEGKRPGLTLNEIGVLLPVSGLSGDIFRDWVCTRCEFRLLDGC